MKHDFQVVVAGGGPAGAWAARTLAQRGISVLLLEGEGPDVDVLCSGLLNNETQQALGIEPPAHVLREPLRPLLEFHDADNRARRRYDPGYLNTHRPQFDAWLRELAQEAGAEVRYNCRVRSLASTDAGAVVATADGDISCAVAIDATGWRALSRKLAHHGKAPQIHAFQGTVRSSLDEAAMWAVYISEVTPFYGWVVPKGGGEFLLGAGFSIGHDTTRAQSADPWSKLDPFAEHVRRLGFDVENIDPKPRGSPITCINGLADLWWGEGRVFTAGEAAGMVSPSSGDGISYSLQSAAALGNVLGRELASGSGGGAGWRDRVLDAVRWELRPALSELRFNCLKARIAASQTWRRLTTPLLPLYLRRKVDRLPF